MVLNFGEIALTVRIGEVIKAYNRSEYKEPMIELIEWYANWLDKIKNLG